MSIGKKDTFGLDSRDDWTACRNAASELESEDVRSRGDVGVLMDEHATAAAADRHRPSGMLDIHCVLANKLAGISKLSAQQWSSAFIGGTP